MAQEIDRNGGVDAVRVQSRLREMVRRRARGVPLQYILGDQPFGELEMLCRRGVLIPRLVFFFLDRKIHYNSLLRFPWRFSSYAG